MNPYTRYAIYILQVHNLDEVTQVVEEVMQSPFDETTLEVDDLVWLACALKYGKVHWFDIVNYCEE